MIWKFWPTSALQSELGDATLEKLGLVLPIVDAKGRSLFFETDRQSLIQLLAAFSSEDYFRKPANIIKCLSYLPALDFEKFAISAELDIRAQDEKSLKVTASKILSSHGKQTFFLEYFHIPDRFKRHEKNQQPGAFVMEPASRRNPIEISSPYKTLKDYQGDLFYRANEALGPPMSRLVLQMPTGSGKTRTAMEIVISALQDGGNTDSSRVLWIANSSELCEQAVQCFVDVAKHVGRVPIQVVRYWSDFSGGSMFDPSVAEKSFSVASFQTLWSKLNSSLSELKMDEIDLLVVDEAHISVARTYEKVIMEFAHKSDCRVLGLTATPGRISEVETHQLAEVFHENILSLQDPSGRFPNTVAYMRSKGVLSHVDYELLEISDSGTLSNLDIKNSEKKSEYADGILKKIGEDDLRNAQIIARLLPHLEKGAKGIVFAPSVLASKFITSMLSFLGVAAGHIDGSLPHAARAELIQSFRDGKLSVLSNFGVLTTGFDDPKTDLVCIARPTKSPVLYSQMLGRGLRGPAVGGTYRCKILEVRDTYINMGLQDDLYKYFDEFWS
jgi:DNA repair protein RadD